MINGGRLTSQPWPTVVSVRLVSDIGQVGARERERERERERREDVGDREKDKPNTERADIPDATYIMCATRAAAGGELDMRCRVPQGQPISLSNAIFAGSWALRLQLVVSCCLSACDFPTPTPEKHLFLCHLSLSLSLPGSHTHQHFRPTTCQPTTDLRHRRREADWKEARSLGGEEGGATSHHLSSLS